MLVTSATEVFIPGIADLVKVQVYHSFRFGELVRGETNLGCQLDTRGKPELGLTIRVGDMHVQSRFFTGEEE
jgi:hypothetical protein